MKKQKRFDVRKLCSCAILVAMAFVLSMFKIPKVFGGSVTFACMVPLVVASYRNGLGWGFASAGVFSVIKLLMGLDNFTYVTGVPSVIAVFLFDYILAYTAVGIAGAIRPKDTDTKTLLSVKAACGALIGMLLRFVCHIVSGAVVWYDLTKIWEAEDSSNIVFKYGKWMYSVVYNGTYMIPETIITVVVTAALVYALGNKIINKELFKRSKSA